jgi:hypothetical protein
VLAPLVPEIRLQQQTKKILPEAPQKRKLRKKFKKVEKGFEKKLKNS